MKSAHTILSHLSQQPQFRYLKRQECYQKYIRLLGEKYQKAIAFVYVKNDILYVAVTHPGFKMELNYNKEVLKSVLSQFTSIEKECDMLQADKIVIFHSKFHKPPQELQQSETIPRYHELSSGEFTLGTENEELLKQFESIRTQIKKNH